MMGISQKGREVTALAIRCRRILLVLVGATGLCLSPAVPAETPEFEITHDGAIVVDLRSGLMWQRCAVGQDWTGSGCEGEPEQFSWSAAAERDYGAFAGYGDWRLPDRGELRSIMDPLYQAPAIDPQIFPDTPPGHFWTRTEDACDDDVAYAGDFESGSVTKRLRHYRHPIRLVRDVSSDS